MIKHAQKNATVTETNNICEGEENRTSKKVPHLKNLQYVNHNVRGEKECGHSTISIKY